MPIEEVKALYVQMRKEVFHSKGDPLSFPEGVIRLKKRTENFIQYCYKWVNGSPYRKLTVDTMAEMYCPYIAGYVDCETENNL